MKCWWLLLALGMSLLGADRACRAADAMPGIALSADGTEFVFNPGGEPFRPRGFNYDRDNAGRLLEDYWEAEWSTVEADFAEMKMLGANVVRIHLQLGKFMESAEQPHNASLDRLALLLKLAEKERLYLDVTGLGCYHKQDVPAWYDDLSEHDRWNVQARFWKAVATTCANSPAIFCYDLMNEPVSPAGKRAEGEWLGPAFAGKHYVQMISLDQQGRPRFEIARQWIRHLTSAIRQVDQHHLVTVGFVDWSLDRPGLTSGFPPDKIADTLDFVSVHLYPESGKLDQALATLAAFNVGKPVVIEETFPLKCTMDEFARFIKDSRKDSSGWIGFYWGKTPDELRESKSLADMLMLNWLEFFTEQSSIESSSM